GSMKEQAFAGAATGPHTGCVGLNGRPPLAGRGPPEGRSQGTPFPDSRRVRRRSAAGQGGTPPGPPGPPPVSYLDARSGDGHNRAAGKGNQQPNHPPGAPTNPQALHRDQPPTPAPQHRPTTHIPGLLGSILGCRGVPVFYPSEGRPLKVIISRRCLF